MKSQIEGRVQSESLSKIIMSLEIPLSDNLFTRQPCPRTDEYLTNRSRHTSPPISETIVNCFKKIIFRNLNHQTKIHNESGNSTMIQFSQTLTVSTFNPEAQQGYSVAKFLWCLFSPKFYGESW